MAGEKVDFEAAASAKADTDGRTYERSAIGFPYNDLDSAIEVAQAVYGRSGIGVCPIDELAAAMNQTTSSGSFRLKTASARTFGLIDRDSQNGVVLTDLGSRIVTPDSEADARVTAFLHVPLYSQIFDKYRGRLLPPTKALEREMQTLGVSSKVSDKARHAFQRSARQAGFFNSGDDRLVRPRAVSVASTSSTSQPETLDQGAADSPPPDRDAPRNRRGGGNGGEYHPFVEGLLQTLPESGTVWTIEGRAAWLEAAASTFKLIYQGDGQIVIQAQPATKKETVSH